MRRLASFAFIAALSTLVGCAEGDRQVGDHASNDDDFASAASTLVDVEFDGQLTAPSTPNVTALIKSQLFYTLGELNGVSSVSRLSKLVLSNVSTSLVSGLMHVKYHAKLPVAWGDKAHVPTSVSFTLPLRADAQGLAAFMTKYQVACRDDDGDEVTTGNYWFHYRPDNAGCTLAAPDVVRVTGKATPSTLNTSGKYPEINRVWEDGTLRVVAVFGKYDAGATDPSDAGITAYDAFVGAVQDAVPNATISPSAAGSAPGAAHPDVTVEGELPDGRSIVVTALLSDEVRSASAAWQKRYAELTPDADVVIYDGHAGLGTNTAALATMGAWFPGKYQILFVNGCDTFAYQDNTLSNTRALLNADDPTGIKYLDTITNAMPAYFSSMPDASLSVLSNLWAQTPRPYEQLFQDVDPAQVVIVDGEEDNVWTPAHAAPVSVLEESGTVAYKEMHAYQTAVLPAGKYGFEMAPEASAPGGDADLRVRVGAAPDGTQTYKCPSYRYNSNERCVVTLKTPGVVYLTATGDKSSQVSSYLVHAFAL